MLTEEYAIRAKAQAHILLNDSARHTVENAGFNQADLRNFIVSTEKRIAECASMAELLSTSTDVITFASAVSSGNARIPQASRAGIWGSRERASCGTSCHSRTD